MDPVKLQEIIDQQVRLLFTAPGDIVFKISSEDVSEEPKEINLSLLLKFILTETKIVKMTTPEGGAVEMTECVDRNKRIRIDE